MKELRQRQEGENISDSVIRECSLSQSVYGDVGLIKFDRDRTELAFESLCF